MRLYILSLLVSASFIVGCGDRAALIAYREAENKGQSTMRAEHLDWSEAIAGVPGKVLPDLSTLTPEQKEAWLNARRRNHTEYKALYEESKEQDAGMWPFRFTKKK